MWDQLTLIEVAPDWHIDEQTKEIGRQGLARAWMVLNNHSANTDFNDQTTRRAA